MTKRAFDKIAAGLEAAADFATGTADLTRYRVHVPADFDVKAIRRAVGMTQEEFSGAYGFSIGTLRDWEQGRARPDTTARAYLIGISREREAVARGPGLPGTVQKTVRTVAPEKRPTARVRSGRPAAPERKWA